MERIKDFHSCVPMFEITWKPFYVIPRLLPLKFNWRIVFSVTFAVNLLFSVAAAFPDEYPSVQYEPLINNAEVTLCCLKLEIPDYCLPMCDGHSMREHFSKKKICDQVYEERRKQCFKTRVEPEPKFSTEKVDVWIRPLPNTTKKYQPYSSDSTDRELKDQGISSQPKVVITKNPPLSGHGRNDKQTSTKASLNQHHVINYLLFTTLSGQFLYRVIF
ncbi:uncharacterized protein LOC142335463 [Convolutriloba macropyga]|uniref:uncharacterized protein LOC142335463 n=1 Tax=Convolutriloba macropyga TaxID=536237 RepID=UPI003F5271E6